MRGGFEFYAPLFLEVALICHLLNQLLRPTSPAHGFLLVGHWRQVSLGGTFFPTFFPTQTSLAASRESACQCFSPPLPRPGARSGKCLFISHVCVPYAKQVHVAAGTVVQSPPAAASHLAELAASILCTQDTSGWYRGGERPPQKSLQRQSRNLSNTIQAKLPQVIKKIWGTATAGAGNVEETCS
jgi:hypothetical protein